MKKNKKNTIRAILDDLKALEQAAKDSRDQSIIRNEIRRLEALTRKKEKTQQFRALR